MTRYNFIYVNSLDSELFLSTKNALMTQSQLFSDDIWHQA